MNKIELTKKVTTIIEKLDSGRIKFVSPNDPTITAIHNIEKDEEGYVNPATVNSLVKSFIKISDI
ncbi:hypothetical protein E2R51_03675 [Jeotgalibacillus sp. S-D1]|uniref:hypothetical protein n=1 Tax=Jeotgalibacillus sp. S-D1 TaxID=2552189 RepID=UPI00105A0308|nr:hypothetical protein [Jeotgalibacillus sp. S-D1]TDL34832.1 hypothetical protein E2R51_03675 [Jeotgalibacillus sp. S-D1]